MNLNISRDWLLRMAEAEGNGIISVGGLVARIKMEEERAAMFDTPAEKLEVIGKALRGAIDDIGEFPCRMDEMTPREAAIAKMCCQLVGTIQFIRRDVLEEEGGPADE